MFEKEIKFISDFSLNKIKKLGSSFTFEKLTATDLHPTVIRYISAELDYMIFADRKKLLQQSYFDYTGKQITQHLHQISDEIKKGKKISIGDAEKLIVQAVSFNTNFVVRPKWSLVKLIYHEQNSVSVEDLEVMLKYVYYYDYIKNVLGAYLSKRKVVQLSLNEFELILNKIDRELFKSNSEQLIDNALNSIGDFFNIGGVDKTIVSAQAVEILLKEKNLIEYLVKLRKSVPEGGKKKLSIDELRRILYAPVEGVSVFPESISGAESEEITIPEETIQNKKSTISFEDNISDIKTTIGELADKHAQEIEKSQPGDILSEEEEKKLLSLYDENLKNLEADISDAISHKDDFDSFRAVKKEDKIHKAEDFGIDSVHKLNLQPFQDDRDKNYNSPEKDIVDEMIKDFFGDEDTDDEKQVAENFPKLNETHEEALVNNDDVLNETEDLPPKLDSSLEDELLEVFDELEKLGEEAEDETSEQDESELSEFDLIDRDLETIDRIAFTEERTNKKIVSEKEDIINTPEVEIKNEPVLEKQKEKQTEIKPQIMNKVKQPENEKPVMKSSFPKPVQVGEENFARPIRKKDLLSYLKRKEIKKIISYVFSGDREDFVTTAERIMDCKGYKEASEILRSVFSSYKVSHYSKDALTFTNAVSNYFRQS